ncbi:ATP-grasp domain-containing protein [Gracilibacillus saliphilus]|uniref:ATP-grasp domain-containing protein n=1 Tax=Gracilibacillus saliphilus TaxID=543890 RepID=UPI0013D2B305|nr:ATP-grasp domain-containing protein [Gracilibacillus saliphilus]
MNILITSSARRIDFVTFFKNSLKDSGIEGNVIVADPDDNAPSLQAGDKSYITPHQTEKNYIDSILKICKKENVHCIVALNDWEVPALSEHKGKFDEMDICLFVPDLAIVEKMRDKAKYRELLAPFEINAPYSYLKVEDALRGLARGEVDYPLIVKPRNGSASMGVEFAYNLEDLKLAYDNAIREILDSPLNEDSEKKPEEDVVIQEVIEGDKFSVDIFNDLDGNFVTTLIRKQLSMRGGDIDRCITVNSPDLIEIGRKIGQNLRHVGYINADVYYNGKDYYVIDINPRFGGGYAFSHRAGANIPLAIIAIALGEEIKEEWLTQKGDVELARHDTVVSIDKEKIKTSPV